jgi:hypothetical protein
MKCCFLHNRNQVSTLDDMNAKIFPKSSVKTGLYDLFETSKNMWNNIIIRLRQTLFTLNFVTVLNVCTDAGNRNGRHAKAVGLSLGNEVAQVLKHIVILPFKSCWQKFKRTK